MENTLTREQLLGCLVAIREVVDKYRSGEDCVDSMDAIEGILDYAGIDLPSEVDEFDE